MQVEPLAKELYTPTCQGSEAGFLFVPPAILSKRPSSVGSYPGATLAGTQAESTMEDFCFMKEIPLTQGKVALVDDEDYPSLVRFKWQAHRAGHSNKWYADRNVDDPIKRTGVRKVLMHVQILPVANGFQVDHHDGNGLNNQRNNLRQCTPTQQRANSRLRKDSASGFKGVRRNKGRWVAYIGVSGKRLHLGSFISKEEAARSYDRAAVEYYGPFASTNFP